MHRWLTLLLASTLLLSAPIASAQAKPAKQDVHAKVEARKKQLRSRVLRKDVGLSEQKAAAVEKVLDKHAGERSKLMRDTQAHRKTLRDLLAKDSNDQAAYQKALAGLRANQTKLATLRQKELDELGKLLTPKEQAKLLVSTKKLERQIRARMRGSAR